MEEWAYQNGVHYPERAGMLAVERGVHDLGTTPLEVGACRADSEFRSAGFDARFDRRPVVLARPQTYNGADPVVPRLTDVTRSGMEVLVREDDGAERVGYLVVEG